MYYCIENLCKSTKNNLNMQILEKEIIRPVQKCGKDAEIKNGRHERRPF